MDSVLRRKSSSRSMGFRTRGQTTRRIDIKIGSRDIITAPTRSFRLNNKELRKHLELFNPTLKSILKVEDIFQKQGEFDSRTQLARELGGSMKIQVLDVILKYLESLGKVLDNEDGSWTWIFSKNNDVLKESWKNAEKL